MSIGSMSMPGEGSSIPYGGGSFVVDQQGGNSQSVPNTTNIGPMEDQFRADDKHSTEDDKAISDARANVETASQLDTSVLRDCLPSHTDITYQQR